MRETLKTPAGHEVLYRTVEKNTNLFNLRCLGLLSLLVALSLVLNILGVFTAPPVTMYISAVLGLFFFCLPLTTVLLHRVIHREKGAFTESDLLEKRGFKYLIVVSTYLGMSIFSTALTLHAVILTVLPAVVAAQYRYEKRLLVWSVAGSVLLVLLGVYGGFFFGMPDRNLLKGNAEGVGIAARLALATPKRMVELFTHYAMPRLLGVVAIGLLTAGIARRNDGMLKAQASLSAQVQEEMARRNSMQSHVIEDLAALIETRDQSTGEHVIRTKRYVGMIAEALRRQGLYADRLSEADIEEMRNAAPLHDVGKISVSDTILLKPGKLTAEEFREIQKHALSGGAVIRRIFQNLENPAFLRVAEQIAVSHHEKWNGKGYPYGLKGEEIPLAARIMAVADVFDALVSPRVYKDPVPPEEALRIIENDSGAHFDPTVVRAVQSIREELIAEAKKPLSREEAAVFNMAATDT